MERYCWLILLATFLALLGALWFFQRRQLQWKLQDESRLSAIAEARQAAFEAERRAAASFQEAEGLRKQSAVIEKELEALREKVRKRPAQPSTLPECMENLGLLTHQVVLLEEALKVERLTVAALSSALTDQTTRADLLDRAWNLERKRSESYQKQAKREKVKKVFLALGVGLAGGAVGYGIGVSK
jgi:hypothetical protein